MSRKTNALKLLGLAVLAGAGVFYYFVHSSDDYVVPVEAQKPITEKEVNDAASKWQHVSEISPTNSASPIIWDPKATVHLAIGSLGLADDSQNGQIADLLLNDLSGAAGLELIDRQSLERVLREQSLNLSGLVRAADAIHVGKLLHADWFLFGTAVANHGTNATVVRLVDARSGTLVNVGVIGDGGGPLVLAQALANFVRSSRSVASKPQPRVYLALGAMEDLSLNSRQINFPGQLRGYLMAAYRNSNVTILEREYVDVLLQEVELDLAGLTDEPGAARRPLQSACWMISGCYQSYENNEFEVEAVLEIEQVIGRHRTQTTFHGIPDTPLFRQIQQAIDEQIQQTTNLFVPTRRTEAMEQMTLGKDLLQAGRQMPGNDFHFGLAFTESSDVQLQGAEKILRHHNLQEALKAFQTVLVLEPTNYEAKLCLAECLQNPTMDKLDEAREIYRQLLEEPIKGQFITYAQFNLVRTFNGLGPWVSSLWYAAAAKKSVKPDIKAYFQERAGTGERYVAYLNGQNGEPDMDEHALALAKSNLLVDLQNVHYAPSAAMANFATKFGTNQASAARELFGFLPEMQARFPSKRFRLLGAILSMQTDTNNGILNQFQQTFDWCLAHPDEVPEPDNFWSDARWEVLPWSFQHSCLNLAEKIIVHDEQNRPINAGYREDDSLLLALEYYRHQQWENALKIFQSYSNRPVVITSSIMTGDENFLFSGPVLTGRYTADCEEHLGRQHVYDRREFQIGKPLLELDGTSTFQADSSGVWVAGHGTLRHLNLNLQVDYQASLPIDNQTAVSRICISQDSVWLGTANEGLLEVGKANHQCRHFTVSDGLLMDSIVQLQWDGDNLWIGYGQGNEGGLGRYRVSAERFQSYMPSFGANTRRPDLLSEIPNQPPRHPVTEIAVGSTGDVFALVSDKGLQRFHTASNTWEILASQKNYNIKSFAFNDTYWVQGDGVAEYEAQIETRVVRGGAPNLIKKTILTVSQDELAAVPENGSTNQAGQRITRTIGSGLLNDRGALEICTPANAKWRTYQDPDGIPNPPGRLALDGDYLWMGGTDYLARLDLAHSEIRFCYLEGAIQRLQICGGYVWAQFDSHLYRLPSNTLP